MKKVDLIFILLHLNMFEKVLATHNTHGPCIQICLTFSNIFLYIVAHLKSLAEIRVDCFFPSSILIFFFFC